MARKRIVFVIVEGISDEESLGVILSRIYDKNEVFIHIMRRDITTENRVTPSNIISKLGNEIREYASSNHYKPADFKEIIHLTDMDGAFIPDESIIDDQNESTIKYSITNIHTCNKKGIEKRNHQKASNLNILCSCKSIWNTPYSLFYMSCNLDHVLHDKLNSNDEEKESDSFSFVKKFKDDISGFITFISRSSFSVMIGYKESWDYIKQGLHSLERHTNLGICFEEQYKPGNI